MSSLAVAGHVIEYSPLKATCGVASSLIMATTYDSANHLTVRKYHCDFHPALVFRQDGTGVVLSKQRYGRYRSQYIVVAGFTILTPPG